MKVLQGTFTNTANNHDDRERPKISSTGPASAIYVIGVVVWSLERVSVRFARAGTPQQAIAATHMNVVPPLGLVLPKPAHLTLYVPGLHLLVISESLPPPPLLVLLIFRRLIALAADSGMFSSIYRPSTPTLLILGKIPIL